MTETYVTYLVWDGCRAPGNLEYNGRLCGQRVGAVSFDREALLELADELEEDACWEVQTPGDTSGAWRLKDACDRIREALGVEP